MQINILLPYKEQFDEKKLSSVSIDNVFLLRSRICPHDANTIYFEPIQEETFPILFGDSRITNVFLFPVRIYIV